MSFSHVIKESFSGFKRAKISGVITIFTITVSLLLLSIFMLILDNTSKVVQNIKNRIEIEVFLIDSISPANTQVIKSTILNINGIDSARYISKLEASQIFKQEFGEDINKVLDFNPLPPSFKVSINDEFKNSDSVKQITKSISALNGVDEVVYRKTLLELLDRRSKLFWQISLGLGIFIAFVSIFLVSNTVRLIIFSKRKIIATMKLVGATEGFIRAPFIMEGIFHGFISGVIASSILYLFLKFGVPLLGEDLFSLLYINDYFFILIIFLGCLLGFIGSIFSIRLFMTKTLRM